MCLLALQFTKHHQDHLHHLSCVYIASQYNYCRLIVCVYVYPSYHIICLYIYPAIISYYLFMYLSLLHNPILQNIKIIQPLQLITRVHTINQLQNFIIGSYITQLATNIGQNVLSCSLVRDKEIFFFFCLTFNSIPMYTIIYLLTNWEVQIKPACLCLHGWQTKQGPT